MFKNIIIAAFSVLSFSLPSFTQVFSLDSVRADALPVVEAPSVQVSPSTAPVQPREWTIIYYSSGKDVKLRSSLLSQIVDLKFADRKDKVNVLVEAPFAEEDAAGAISTVTARLVVGSSWDLKTRDAVAASALSEHRYVSPSYLEAFGGDVISREYNVDSGDWRRAAAFAKWAKTSYPAKHYLFLIYGHGNGFFDYKTTTSRSTLSDNESGNYVSVPEMRLMMAEIGKVDLFVMQSCLMQTAEVAWEVKDYADVLLGSSEFLWTVGYPIGPVAEGLAAEPGIPAAELSGYMAEGYVNGLKRVGKTGHSSVIVTANLKTFGGKLDAWADAVMALKDRTLLFPALKQAVRYDILGMDSTPNGPYAKNLSFSADLYDFVKLTGETLPADRPETAAVKVRGQELLEYISGALVYKHAYTGISDTGFDLSRSGGISIHLPRVKDIDPAAPIGRGKKQVNYWTLPFAGETRWGVFLDWLYGN